MKIKKGDQVLITKGKDRTKIGKVLNVLPGRNSILVEGLNMRKKHVKPKKQGEKGQTVQIPVPMQAANVKLICPKCSKAVRVGYRVEKDRKFRICKKCNQEI